MNHRMSAISMVYLFSSDIIDQLFRLWVLAASSSAAQNLHNIVTKITTHHRCLLNEGGNEWKHHHIHLITIPY